MRESVIKRVLFGVLAVMGTACATNVDALQDQEPCPIYETATGCPDNAQCCGGGCDGINPNAADAGKVACSSDWRWVGESSPIYGHDGAEVGSVGLKYSCTCRAWWTKTLRSTTDARWYNSNYEIAASFAGEADQGRCPEPPAVSGPVDDGATTYACHTSEHEIFNNMRGSSMPTGCGWIRLKESQSDPDVFDVFQFGGCTGPGGNTPPDCTQAKASPGFSYARAHMPTTVNIIDVTDADGDPITITIEECVSSQPDNTTGDGNTTQDCQGVGTPAATILAERRGDFSGARVYTIKFTARDGRGGSCDVPGGVTSTVFHDHRPIP